MAIELSPDQREVYDTVKSWSEVDAQCFDGSLLRMGGLAGTGKTTLVSHFARETKLLVAYVAYTGRAASLLARKFKAAGVVSTSRTQLPEGQALRGRALDVCYAAGSKESRLPFVGTIHRLLYRPLIDSKTEELRGWEKRVKPDRKYDLIVVDEASMVGDDILADLQALGIPIWAVGDHGQLPPVMSRGSLMQNPDVRLEKIHRQAEGNPVIALAHHIRNGGLFREFQSLDSRVTFAQKGEVARVLEETLRGSPGLSCAVICWTNRMRVRLNGMARAALGFKGPPRKGELVVALRNYPPVMNGMRGLLKKDAEKGQRPWHLFLDVDFPEEALSESLMACAPQFNREKTYASVEELQERGIDVESMGGAGRLYDFGYALTAHKMQGSSAEHVVFYLDRPEDPNNEDYRRLVYTGITRSSDRLTILR